MNNNEQDVVLEFKDVSFSYAGSERSVLSGASLAVPTHAFCLLVGDTGSGKTTLLRLAKPEIAPTGTRTGIMRVLGRDPGKLSPLESASGIGFVFQSPENQIVCDTVWHELAFGLENLGVSQVEMRRRVAEVCYFFGMESWLHRKTAELSGGQRQVLALAATLVMRPQLLLLDEPTSMLDPIAEKNFLSLLFRVNRELGCTVVVATHRPRPMLDMATLAFRVRDGKTEEVPLESLEHGDVTKLRGRKVTFTSGEAIRVREAWLRYDRDADWVLRGLDFSATRGEVRAVVGGNGSGKSTLLGLISGVVKSQHGKVSNDLKSSQAFLPQNPKALLSQQSVREELMEWAHTGGYQLRDATNMLLRLGFGAGARMEDGEPLGAALLDRHPYDLSGGEQQLLALAKLLLVKPQLLLLDEPTKGLDHKARSHMAQALIQSRDAGTTIVMATHDLSFARPVADSVSLLFDGDVTLTQPCEEFFRDSWVWRV